MNPWETFWIALGWLLCVALLLVVALLVFFMALEGLRQVRKELRRPNVDLNREFYLDAAADEAMQGFRDTDPAWRSTLQKTFQAGAAWGYDHLSKTR